jgi:importin subunit alpha-1
VTVALEGLENILRVGQEDAQKKGMSVSEYGQYIDSEGGLDKIEQLQNHQQNEIYEKAMKIIQKYFGFEDEDAGVEPQMDAAQQFAFGGAAAPAQGFNFAPQ